MYLLSLGATLDLVLIEPALKERVVHVSYGCVVREVSLCLSHGLLKP